MKTNSKGQVLGQKCHFCGRPSEVCAGRCSACKGHVEWKEKERLYECPCGQSVLQIIKGKIGWKNEENS